jgi:hypothetical protein
MTTRRAKPAPVLPPNQCSHVVRFYEYRAKTDTSAPLHQYAIAPWILLDARAQAYAVTMVLPGRFNVI